MKNYENDPSTYPQRSKRAAQYVVMHFKQKMHWAPRNRFIHSVIVLQSDARRDFNFIASDVKPQALTQLIEKMLT